ncbi:hypothetical protein [Altibacter sp. HG106]|uniref:hypothetical protein n=1 Tax=Altibacter sp. HG106 TaxID=3023937 RepID=UPI0023501EBD|nr:hypothetical protein [Altibacter sp. HG106]MDC7994091.1 hypothetical protein [Altibacter sp. HG106]
MKKIILVLFIALFSVTSFATEKSSQIAEQLSEQPPSCFQQCNTAGQIFRDLYGWTAIQFGTWVVGCTNACQQNQQ